MNQKTSTIVLLVLIALIMVGTSAGFYFGRVQGYNIGYSEGKIIGYNTGYPIGYDFGYSNGTEDGYAKGYTAGNSVGYGVGNSVGLTTGYSSGFSIGNTTGYKLGEEDGYTSGYQKGWTTTGFNIRDPTYKEMLAFVSSDKTDELTYVDSSYVCHDFTIDVKINAFNTGYRCFFVYIEMGNLMPVKLAHALIAFNTTDKGIVYIEPQSDRITTVRVGQPYWDRAIYQKPSYDDTVTKITLIP